MGSQVDKGSVIVGCARSVQDLRCACVDDVYMCGDDVCMCLCCANVCVVRVC